MRQNFSLEKRRSLQQMGWVYWISACRNIKQRYPLKSYTKINSSQMKDLKTNTRSHQFFRGINMNKTARHCPRKTLLGSNNKNRDSESKTSNMITRRYKASIQHRKHSKNKEETDKIGKNNFKKLELS